MNEPIRTIIAQCYDALIAAGMTREGAFKLMMTQSAMRMEGGEAAAIACLQGLLRVGEGQERNQRGALQQQ